MSSWTLAPCLKCLFDEFDLIAPDRDHTTDGSIGDDDHQNTDSDHNPDNNGFVCAIDVDKDLRASFTMEDVVQYLLGECRKSNNVGLDRGRINYIIYKRRIWRADTGWIEEYYDGENPHDQHVHISCEHDLNYVNDTRTWGLIERFGGGLPVDQTEFNKLFSQALTDVKIQDLKFPNDTKRNLSWRTWIGYSDGRADVGRVEKKVDDLTKLVTDFINGAKQ